MCDTIISDREQEVLDENTRLTRENIKHQHDKAALNVVIAGLIEELEQSRQRSEYIESCYKHLSEGKEIPSPKAIKINVIRTCHTHTPYPNQSINETFARGLIAVLTDCLVSLSPISVNEAINRAALNSKFREEPGLLDDM